MYAEPTRPQPFGYTADGGPQNKQNDLEKKFLSPRKF